MVVHIAAANNGEELIGSPSLVVHASVEFAEVQCEACQLAQAISTKPVDIENANDKELSKSLYLGGRQSINDNMYLGIKGSYSMIDGPTDKLNISYDDITIKSLSLIVGYNF